MMFSSAKGNALLVFLLIVAFFALSGAAMWFLSDVTPLSNDYNDISSPVMTLVSPVGDTATSSPIDTTKEDTESLVAQTSSEEKTATASLLVPTINPLSGVYTNPFE